MERGGAVVTAPSAWAGDRTCRGTLGKITVDGNVKVVSATTGTGLDIPAEGDGFGDPNSAPLTASASARDAWATIGGLVSQ